MGYNVWLSSKSKFRLPGDKIEACLASIVGTTNQWLASSVKDAVKGIKYFDHLPVPLKFMELVNHIWGFKVTYNDKNDVEKLDYELEKMHDFDDFFNAIAPSVDSGSYLEFTGEDAEKWRYVFRDGKWKKVKPVVTWPED